MKAFFSKNTGIIFVLIFIFSFIVSVNVFAIEDNSESVVQKYGIKFPVENLGNCTSLNECKTYCNDPVNQTQCIEFAKQKGFYKEKINAVKHAISIAAQQELGCDSEKSCKVFCSEQANWQACGNFAKNHKLGGGQIEDPSKKEIISKAKESLGCDSLETCRGFCKLEENQQKCDEFAKLTGLRGGVEKTGPGGCSSLESCKTFCSDPENFQLCQGFVKAAGGNFKGPGSCDSEDSCRAYCKVHESECKYFFREPEKPTTVKPEDYCNKTPNCSWLDNRCECKSYTIPSHSPVSSTNDYTQFCKEHPEKCPVTKIYSPSPSASPYDYAKKCADYGCSWTGTSCSCVNKTPYPATAPTIRPTSTPTSSATTCQPPSNGCGSYNYFDKASCSCKSYQDYCNAKVGCNWTENTCKCTSTTPTPTVQPSPTTNTTTGTAPAVQGVSIVKSVWGRLMDSFRK